MLEDRHSKMMRLLWARLLILWGLSVGFSAKPHTRSEIDVESEVVEAPGAFPVPTITASTGEVLLTIPITGSGDLHIRVGDDPCRPMEDLCTQRHGGNAAGYRGSNGVEQCLAQLVPPVQKALERSWPRMHDQLVLSDAYFCGCHACRLGSSMLNVGDMSEQSLRLIDLLRRAIASRDAKSPYLEEYNEKRVSLPQGEKLRHYRKALELVPSSAYVIDQLGLALKQHGRKKSAKLLFRNAVTKGIFPSELQRPPRYVEGLPAQPWYEPSEFNFVEYLISRGDEIQQEFADYIHRDQTGISLQEEGLHGTGRWEELVIMKHDSLFAGRAFAATVGIIKSINEASSPNVHVFNAKFSILHPGTTIRPHCGPSNARLRLHLTIQHGSGGAWIRVGRQNKTWEEGGVLIFDDSFEHEVQHTGKSPRVVLIVDFWHPQLPQNKRIFQ